ncbi:UNVERIFIED_CONTAM: hypothetical protein FKN15_057880 [Acipenser sinensis]
MNAALPLMDLTEDNVCGDVMFLGSAHRYHPCADSLSPEAYAVSRLLFSHCGLTMQPPKSNSVGGQRSSLAAYSQARRCPARLQGSLVHDHTSIFKTDSEDNAALWQLTVKPAGARPDYRGRWCTVSRGHPG